MTAPWVRKTLGFALECAVNSLNNALRDPIQEEFEQRERIATRRCFERNKEIAKIREDVYGEYDDVIGDLRQIALVASKRGLSFKHSYHGVVLVMNASGMKVYKGGQVVDNLREINIKTLYAFRTHYNYLVVPA